MGCLRFRVNSINCEYFQGHIMELITLSIGYIINTFAKNEAVQEAVDDFFSESVRWISGWFKKSGQESLVQKLESGSASKEVQTEIETVMTDMVQDDQFRAELTKWIQEYQKPEPTMKNVLEDVELDIEGNVNIGDKDGGGQSFDKKNVVKSSKIKSGGDFNLGDITS